MGTVNSVMELPSGEEYLGQCCLALRECASVRLIHAPKELKETVEKTINKHWSPGGRKTIDTASLWEYRLKGLPFWNSFSSQRSLQVHSLVCYMLDDMQIIGWDVQTATDLSRCKDLSTFFLKKTNKTQSERDDPRQMFSATLAEKNKIHVVNAPKQVLTQLRAIFTTHWTKGIQRAQKTKYGVIFTLKGEPWSDKKTPSLQASSLVHRLVYMMGLMGWDVSTIARVKNYRDTIFFRQKRMKRFDDLVGCFLSISFYGKNRLRLIHCSDPSLADAIEELIHESWDLGLEGVRKIHGTIEFRLNGKPFWADSTDGIDSKLLVCALFFMLQKRGWRIHNFISSTRSLENKGTLLFKKETSSDISPMCISFDDEDKIRLIAAGDDVKCVLRNVITQRLGQNGIVREGNFRNCWEFRLHRTPWTGISSEEGIKVRSLLCHILQKLSFKGWYVMTSFDVCSKIIKSDDRHPQPLDAQSWYFCKKENIDQAVKLWKKTADLEASNNKRKNMWATAKKACSSPQLTTSTNSDPLQTTTSQTDIISPLVEEVTPELTPESSLTNDVKTEVKIEKEGVIMETTDYDEKELENLIIEEESLEPVKCGNNIAILPIDCKTISPEPAHNAEEFEIPEIHDDIINTIYSDPPIFEKKTTKTKKK